MRKIGTLTTETDAIRFGDYLFVKGIENNIEDGGGAFEVWVHDDEQLAEARRHLDAFLANPGAAEFSTSKDAERIRREQERADARKKSRVITRERLGYERNFVGFASVPMVLAVLSVIVTMFAGELGLLPGSMPSATPEEIAKAERLFEHREWLTMTRFITPKVEDAEQIVKGLGNPSRFGRFFADRSLPEVRRGEVWRLITPIFIHFGILHLVFNLMWLRDLGGFFQDRFGVRYLVLFIVITGAASNYGQLLWQGPMFGGLSGVNYALFGYLWMRGKHDRFAAWALNPQLVQMMMIWFVACAVGLIPNVANFAHGVGLVAGMAWGYISGKRSRGAR